MADTGGRTPSAPDRGVCAISPSDLVGHVGNLINRVKELEQEVAELKAKNVEVNQLSDISQQIGWVDGIIYAGTSGWTRTAAGTLIPPPGFYIGNVIPGYHAGFYDASGNLTLGFGSDGTISGSGWPGSNYVSFNTLSGSPGGNLTLGAISATSGSFYTWNGTDTVTITEKGIYAYNLIIGNGSSADTNDNERFHLSQDFGWPFSFSSAEWAGLVDEDSRFTIGGVNIGIVTTVPCTVRVQWIAADDLSATIGSSSFQIIKLGSIA